MSDRFENDLRAQLHNEAREVSSFPRPLAERIREGIEPRAGFGVRQQLALAAGLLLFAGLLAYGVSQLRAGGKSGLGGNPTPAPTVSPVGTASPLPTASGSGLGPFTCQDRSGGSPTASSQLVAIRIAHHAGYDRITFEFSGDQPSYQLTRQASAHFLKDASGQPVTLNGSAGMKVTFHNTDLSAAVSNDQTPNLPVVKEVQNIGNFERVVSFGVGLSSPACVRVLEYQSTTRLVIDFQTAG